MCKTHDATPSVPRRALRGAACRGGLLALCSSRVCLGFETLDKLRDRRRRHPDHAVNTYDPQQATSHELIHLRALETQHLSGFVDPIQRLRHGDPLRRVTARTLTRVHALRWWT